jgi:hypothetical protein
MFETADAIQVISSAASAPKQKERAVELQKTVERIAWALREVLLGQRERIIRTLLFHSHSHLTAEKSKTAV